LVSDSMVGGGARRRVGRDKPTLRD
jgi:hypothetical protein